MLQRRKEGSSLFLLPGSREVGGSEGWGRVAERESLIPSLRNFEKGWDDAMEVKKNSGKNGERDENMKGVELFILHINFFKEFLTG
jgi:hypothetical protein